MKKVVVVAKSSIEREFKKIKEKYYKKRVNNKTDQAYILKQYFGVSNIYVDDIKDEDRQGKSVYIEYKDGTKEQVSVSTILKNT